MSALGPALDQPTKTLGVQYLEVGVELATNVRVQNVVLIERNKFGLRHFLITQRLAQDIGPPRFWGLRRGPEPEKVPVTKLIRNFKFQHSLGKSEFWGRVFCSSVLCNQLWPNGITKARDPHGRDPEPTGWGVGLLRFPGH